ncbi:hypothetical protein [Rhizorhapis suberifaciens]|uniref:Uncharacterized protein n=1 Tax=Rhizorhapis suberifaciens TaxID=13656 RepID=A0A840HPM6_9SPHN|nr:hypothetical protein [Rhizorhapis suberifaciens]MBB4640002.1 hypothetical protein [Rhizorhapis suberifaciens]
MRRTIAIGSATILFATGNSAALAREYYYFYKPNVSRDEYVADRSECDRLSGGVTAKGAGLPSTYYMPRNSNLTAGQNAIAAGLAGLFTGLMSGSAVRKTTNTVERTCMADKGYLRYAVDKLVVKNIEKLSRIEDRVEHYFALATAGLPVGKRIVE